MEYRCSIRFLTRFSPVVRFSAKKTTTSVTATLMMMVNITRHHRREASREPYLDADCDPDGGPDCDTDCVISLRTSATWSVLTTEARLPQALRIYVARSAISSSESFQPNAGIARPVGLARVATTLAPPMMACRMVAGSPACTAASALSGGNTFAKPSPLFMWQPAQLSR